ncbi:beta-glucosidase family protein [Alkalicaulis satelles]|uniref:beta-glucosidase family protein n=1 Tax=Alkalicaulis satelles TaxID=2609175 RepID=UPI0018EB41B3|nr:glycoside hydrolase family 3 C-terminal domain-containing protein [Alkalicaulis satelles]
MDAVLRRASLEEKIAMMSGRGFFQQFMADGGVWGASPYQAGARCDRLGVPAFYFSDGPRGVARGQSTCFPVSMARGASFDTDLERRIGEVIGIEMRAQGCNLSGAVCINLLRHPAWGRAQETYGEDPYLLGEMGAALSEGIQTHNVAATVKHFAANSVENARFKIDVQMDERALHEVYLPHFRRVIEAGCLTVMSAYNKLNGEYCGENQTLLTDILRREWGFEGFVHSDWVLGVYSPWGAAAGLDVENPEPVHYGDKLRQAVESGAIAASVVDTACKRILTVLFSLQAAQDPLESYAPSLVASPAHCALAREAAVKSAVLLRNEGAALPLPESAVIAVAGRLTDTINTGDGGSSRVRPPYVITPLAGLQEALAEERVWFAGDETDPAAAAASVAGADAVIIVAGYTAEEEGEYIPGDINLGQVSDALPEGVREASEAANTERQGGKPVGGDRGDLGLPEDQVALIKAIAAVHPRVIVVIEAGSAVIVRDWIEDVSAAMQIFYPGMEGGRALADLLTGAENPAGRLPFTVARDAAHYPYFDKNADAITYDLWHGYAKFDREGLEPEFAFGHGLSYTSFNYRALKARADKDGGLSVQVSVTNTGECAGDEVVQLYVSAPGKLAERWRKQLKGFERIHLEPGETRSVFFTVAARDLAFRRNGAWITEPGAYGIHVGGSSAPSALISAQVEL